VLHDDKVIAELSRSEESPTEGYGSGTSYYGSGTGDDADGSEDGGGNSNSGGEPGPDDEPAIEGFVALGRTLPTSFAQVNFDDAANGAPSIVNGSPPTPGAILKARWSVNLRENTTITTGGRNPILAVIGEGECVKVSGEPQALRGQFWAAVNRTECPE
jgi:hypothetical protein